MQVFELNSGNHVGLSVEKEITQVKQELKYFKVTTTWILWIENTCSYLHLFVDMTNFKNFQDQKAKNKY